MVSNTKIKVVWARACALMFRLTQPRTCRTLHQRKKILLFTKKTYIWTNGSCLDAVWPSLFECQKKYILKIFHKDKIKTPVAPKRQQHFGPTCWNTFLTTHANAATNAKKASQTPRDLKLSSRRLCKVHGDWPVRGGQVC